MGNTPIYRHPRFGAPRARIRRVSALLLATVLLHAAAWMAAPAAHAQTDEEMVSGKERANLSFEFRTRYEFQEGAPFPDDANAGTIMGRAGYHIRKKEKTSAFVELEGVFAAIDEYRDTDGFTAQQYPTIQDPDGFGVNQAYVTFTAPMELVFRAGRQRISFGNERHIGPDPWRQNDRTFDGVSVHSSFLDNADLDTIISDVNIQVAYVFAVNQPDFERRDVEAFLSSLDFAMWASQKTRVAFYSYLIDDNEFKVRDITSATFGWRYQRDYRPINGHARVIMEAAMQDNYQAKSAYTTDPRFFDKGTLYGLIEGEYRLGTLQVNGGYEVFTSTYNYGRYYAFQTPWGSNHDFNGWRDAAGGAHTSDTDYPIPKYGLHDLFVQLSGDLWGTHWYGAFHQLKPDDGVVGSDYGPEFNLGLSREVGRDASIGLRFIAFNSNHQDYWNVVRATAYYEARF